MLLYRVQTATNVVLFHGHLFHSKCIHCIHLDFYLFILLYEPVILVTPSITSYPPFKAKQKHYLFLVFSFCWVWLRRRKVGWIDVGAGFQSGRKNPGLWSSPWVDYLVAMRPQEIAHFSGASAWPSVKWGQAHTPSHSFIPGDRMNTDPPCSAPVHYRNNCSHASSPSAVSCALIGCDLVRA